MRVYKYNLVPQDVLVIKMPRGARPLSVHMQNNIACMWALVDPNEEDEELVFYMHGTGHEVINPEAQFLGTIYPDSLVFHIFWERK